MCAPEAHPIVDTLATGLDTPWDVAFLPDGAALITERSGTIRRISPTGALDPEPWLRFDTYSPTGSEIGLMGIDVDPTGTYVYFTATHGPAPGALAALGRRLRSLASVDAGAAVTLSVHRVPLDPAAPRMPEPVVTGIASGFLHGGGALRFSPDGILFLTNGDGGDHPMAQHPGSMRGKILRITPPDGSRSGSAAVHASGIRHSQGIAWLDDARAVFIDHGPTGLDSEGGRSGRDELNLLGEDANYGWPAVAGASEGEGAVAPIVTWTPALAPAGLATYDDPAGPWRRSIFVTGLVGNRLERLQIARNTSDPPVVACKVHLLEGTHGRLRLVRQAPGGGIWVGTSNRDGRGAPRPGDDHILVLHPPPAGEAPAGGAPTSF